MASRGSTYLAFSVVLFCVLSSVIATLEDGRPRPKNFPDLPTVTYDNTPTLVDSTGFPVDCTWYGFANENFDATTGSTCLAVLRKALTNATVNPPSNMQPYVYYTLKRLVDPATNESYCYQGCFNLGASLAPAPGPSALSPSNAFAPSPVATTAPPPVTFGVPPSSSFSPAPSVSSGAPPPLDASTPPSSAAVPPASIDAPTTSAPAPDVAVAPVASSPPPPGVTGPVVIPNIGVFLQPTFLGPVLVTAVALFVSFAT